MRLGGPRAPQKRLGGGMRNSLKCHQSVPSQQSSTNRCGTTSKSGEAAGSRAQRSLGALTPSTDSKAPTRETSCFWCLLGCNLKALSACGALMCETRENRATVSGPRTAALRKLTVSARQVRTHTGPLKGGRRPAVQLRLCNYLTCSYCSFMQMRGTMCDDGD